jgi:GxxExxY protein
MSLNSILILSCPQLRVSSPPRRRGRRGFAERKTHVPSRKRNHHAVIGAAMEVHRSLGPGLLESAYHQCLCRELVIRGVPFEYERKLPLEYKGLQLEQTYRIDLVVASQVVVEVKSIEAIAPIHEAQLLTYLRLGGWNVGLLINFNVVVLKDGIRRRVLGLRE